jgi:group I intron endonuclease
MRSGIIYKATSPDGKVYIGQTVKTLAQRRGDHAYCAKKGDRRGAFQIAILEHGGVNAFTWEKIDIFETAEELSQKEQYWTAYYKADDPAHGYNGTNGGIEGTLTAEVRKKISKALKGHLVTEETRRKLSESHKGKPSNNKGKKASEETRRKLSEAHKGVQAGEKHPMTKLTEAIVRQIKTDFLSGATLGYIQKKYGVTKAIAFQIKSGRTWKDVEAA